MYLPTVLSNTEMLFALRSTELVRLAPVVLIVATRYINNLRLLIYVTFETYLLKIAFNLELRYLYRECS